MLPRRLFLALIFSTSSFASTSGCTRASGAAACSASDTAATPTTVADLMAIDAEFSRLSVDRGAVVAFDRYLADDAVELPNGEHAQRGKPAILASLREDFASGNLVLKWTPVAGAVATSGELGFTYGTFELDVKKPDGTVEVHHGKYTTIWRRGADGWRVALDMGNKSPAPK